MAMQGCGHPGGRSVEVGISDPTEPAASVIKDTNLLVKVQRPSDECAPRTSHNRLTGERSFRKGSFSHIAQILQQAVSLAEGIGWVETIRDLSILNPYIAGSKQKQETHQKSERR